MKNKLCVLAGIVLLFAVNTCSDTAGGGGASYTINGRVAATDDGSPQGAVVRLKQNGAEVGSAVAGEDGGFDIHGVRAGYYTIDASHGEYSGSTDIAVSRNVSGIDLVLSRQLDAVSGASTTMPAKGSGSAATSAPIPMPVTELAANFAEIKTKPAGGAYRVEWTVDGVSRPWNMSGFNTPVTIVIDGRGKYVTLEGGYNGKGSLLAVPDGVTIFLKDITFYGCDTNTKAIVTVESGGTLVMKDGVKITGARRSPVDGGAVKVKGGGVFHMDGGEISDNTGIANGGAVFVSGGGEFVMRGGKIIGNQASNCGGVFLYGGNFEMQGGEISGNTSKNYAGAVLVNGGAFDMKDGAVIKDNKCHLYGGGVFVGYYSHLSGSSGGVFTQWGGEISGNRAAGGGGGVSLRGSSAYFVFEDGSITGNLAVPDDTIDPYGGGGVFVQDGALFEFNGGSITGNHTEYELYGGGGILSSSKDGGDAGAEVDAVSGASGGGSVGAGSSGQDPNMAITGGTVSGNTAGNGMGAGIYAESGSFTLSGSPAISDRVCVQYQPQAERHILIDGDFTGTIAVMDLRGNKGGIASIGNWIKPVLAMSGGGSIPSAVTSRFPLGTFAPYSGSAVSISGYKINEAGKVVKK